MVTNIPPHNLREVIAGTIFLINNPDATIDDLMEFIPAPDFPTGAQIMGVSGTRAAYRRGRGRIAVSYTHLDVYKRQGVSRVEHSSRRVRAGRCE